MRWDDERYVKVYTRDTGTWASMGWEARGLFVLLLRIVDRAGVLSLPSSDPKVLAAMLRAPPRVVRAALKTWLDLGMVAVDHPPTSDDLRSTSDDLRSTSDDLRSTSDDHRRLIVINFLKAQESRTSDKERQRKSRELARSLSRSVTRRHTASRSVTPRVDESRVDESRVDESRREEEAPPDGRRSLSDRLCKSFLDLTGSKYGFAGAKDGQALKRLLALGGHDEIDAAWRRALQSKSFPTVRTIAELSSAWNHYAIDGPVRPRPKSVEEQEAEYRKIMGIPT